MHSQFFLTFFKSKSCYEHCFQNTSLGMGRVMCFSTEYSIFANSQLDLFFYPQKHVIIDSQQLNHAVIQQKCQENSFNLLASKCDLVSTHVVCSASIMMDCSRTFYQVCGVTDVERTAYLSVMATCSNMADPVLLFQLPEMDVRLEEKN